MAVEIDRHALDIERNRGDLNAHERECAERYRRIDEHLTSQGDTIREIATKVGDLSIKAAVQPVVQEHRLSQVQLWVVSGLVAVLAGALIWTAKEIYSFQTARLSPVAVSTPRH